MRVALNGYFWDQPRTGSGQYLRHLWSALLARPDTLTSTGGDALEIVMLLPSGSGDEPPPTKPGASVAYPPPNLLPNRGQNLGKLLWEQWGVSRQARLHQADLLHTPYLTAPLLNSHSASGQRRLIQKSSPAAHKSKIRNRNVVTAHDMIPWVVPGYAGSRFFKLYLALAASCVRSAGAIMADSEASRRDVIRVLGVSPGRVHTVYLGAEPPPQYTQSDLNEVRARFGLPSRYAFYLGGFDKRKNVPLLLRAWRGALSSLDTPDGDSPMLAIGGVVPEPGGIFPDVRGEARSLGLSGPAAPVRFLGRVSESDKPLLMAAARLFAYPSAYEGFGLDPLEAMSVGCPVVSSSGGSLAEVVGNGGLLVPPNDESALINAIALAWHDADLRTRLAEQGSAQASKFTWERTARQTLQVYRHALQRRRSSR